MQFKQMCLETFRLISLKGLSSAVLISIWTLIQSRTEPYMYWFYQL